MVNKNNKVQNSSSIMPLLVILICALLGYMLINPKIAQLKDYNTKIAAKEKDTTALNEKIQNLKTLQKQFNDSPGDVELLNLAIADTSQLPEIIEQLNSIASKSGMSVRSIRPDYREASNESIISVTLRGEYTNLINYTSELEKNLRPASIKSLNMSSSSSQNQSILDSTLAIGFFTAKNSSITDIVSTNGQEAE